MGEYRTEDKNDKTVDSKIMNHDEKDRKKDRLKTPIRVYILILVAVTVAAVVIGTSIHVVPAVRNFTSRVSDVIESAVNNTVISTDGVEIKIGAEDLDELVDEAMEQVNDGLNSDGYAAADGDTETGNWTRENTDGIRNIDVDTDLINLTIRTGDVLEARWTCESDLVPEIHVNGDTLEIRQSGKIKIGFFSFGLSDLENLGAGLVVTVPADMTLDKLTIEADCGNIVLNGLQSQKAEIGADLGNITISGCVFGQTEISADCGNVTVSDVQGGKTEIEADLGNIVLAGGSFDRLGIRADCGRISCANITADRVSLSADAGSIDISGSYNALTAECSLGSITVMTDKPETEVQLDLSADLGVVTVNGRQY